MNDKGPEKSMLSEMMRLLGSPSMLIGLPWAAWTRRKIAAVYSGVQYSHEP